MYSAAYVALPFNVSLQAITDTWFSPTLLDEISAIQFTYVPSRKILVPPLTNESSERRCLTQIMRAPKGGRGAP